MLNKSYESDLKTTIPRKKKLLIIIIVIIIFIIGIAAFLFFLPGENLIIPIQGHTIILNNPPRLHDVIPYLQDGDIILRMTEGTWSMMFREFSPIDKRFSHCGIVRIRDDEITVINALGSLSIPSLGVEETRLDRFIPVASAVGIYRVRDADGSVISDTAMLYMGRPFDFDFDMEDDSKVYCTELIYLALKPVKPENILPTIFVDEVKRQAIPIDSISNNPYIDEIVFFVNQSSSINYEDYIVLNRDNPVKVWVLRRLVFLLGIIRK
jgi:hypothetical protein